MDERAERIARAAQAVRDAEVPDKLNRWLTMTPDELASMLDRNERSPAMMTIKTNESRGGRLPVPPPRAPEASATETPFSASPNTPAPNNPLQVVKKHANTADTAPATGAAAKPSAKESPMKTAAKTKTKTAAPAKTGKTKAKAAPATTRRKAGEKAAARSSARGAAPRPGSKTELIRGLLTRAKGCTTADVLEATSWPSVSMPQQAKALGLTLKKEKEKGKPTVYRAE